MLVQTSPEDFLRSLEDAKAERRRQRETERGLDSRPLDPWERYRALVDYYRALQDLSEQGDRKTRFALLILGSINAVNLLIVMRGSAVGLTLQDGTAVQLYVACYALLSLGVFVYAIAALRPSALREPSAAGGGPPPLWSPDAPIGQRFEDYCENWRRSDVGQLNRELAALVYRSANANTQRLRSLGRVYLGLYVLVALTGALLVALGAAAL